MKYNWISLFGKFHQDDQIITFEGGEMEYTPGNKGPALGNHICDQKFDNGLIEVIVIFEKFSASSGAEIIISYDAQTHSMLTAGISGNTNSAFNIRSFNGTNWGIYSQSGQTVNITNGVEYHIKVSIVGSVVALYINNVRVCFATLPEPLVLNQVGIWALGYEKIQFKNYSISKVATKAFVVMQFSSDYHEVYEQVIKNVCNEFSIEPVRADEIYNNGLVIDDIAESIQEASIIIAEITEKNPNVFYEVGYAHALNKPTILLAKKGTKLPFDVSPFRILFYEDSIGGKVKFEESLRKHIKSIYNNYLD